MDGLTVFQAVLGGIQVIGKIYEAVEKLRSAPDSIKCLMTEIAVLKRILEQLKPLILDHEHQPSEGAQHVGLGDLVLIFTDLTKTLSRFDKFITQVSKRTGLVATNLAKNSLWVKNEHRFKRDLDKLQYIKSSLTVMLALLERLV